MMQLKHLMYIPSYIIPFAATFASLIVFTRLMTPEMYGFLALILVTVEVVQGVFFQWLRMGYLRFHAEQASEEQLIAIIVRSSSLAFLLSMVVLALYSIGRELTLGQYLLILVLSGLKSAYLFLLETQRAKDQTGKYLVMAFTQSLLGPMLSIGLVLFYEVSVTSALIGLCIGFLAAIFIDIKTFGMAFKLSLKIDTKLQQQVFRYAFPFIITFLFTALATRIDRYMIDSLLDVRSVGFYSAAESIIMNFAMVIFAIVALPTYTKTMSSMANEGRRVAEKRHQFTLTLLLAALVPSIVLFLLLFEPVFRLLIGDLYFEATHEMIPWLLAAVIVLGFKLHYLDQIFQFIKKNHLAIFTVIPVGLVNIGLNMVLIPKYGIAGSAMGSLVAFTIGFLVSWWLTRRYFSVNVPWKNVLIVFLYAMGLWIVVDQIMRTHVHVLMHLSLSIISYAVVMSALLYQLKIFSSQSNTQLENERVNP